MRKAPHTLWHPVRPHHSLPQCQPFPGRQSGKAAPSIGAGGGKQLPFGQSLFNVAVNCTLENGLTATFVGGMVVEEETKE